MLLQIIVNLLIFTNSFVTPNLLETHFAQLLVTNKLNVDVSGLGASEINGAGLCAMMAGCKIIGGRQGCYGPSGTNICAKCQHIGAVSKRNVMRTDFYKFDSELIRKCRPADENCPQLPYLNELHDFMLLKGDSVARAPQGAVYSERHDDDYFQIPHFRYGIHYFSKFCGAKCFKRLRHACLQVTLLPHVRHWCLTAYKWIEDDQESLVGPASYVLFLAARLVDPMNDLEPVDDIKCIEYKDKEHDTFSATGYEKIPCKWPKSSPGAEFEERAALVGAACASVLLSGRWFKDERFFVEHFRQFGYAVHHSLWLAIFMGRLRITIHPLEKEYRKSAQIIPGTETLCSAKDRKIAENYEGITGTGYASLCALFKKAKRGPSAKFILPNIRFRPEIHVRHTQGCVERTAGMMFIRPGDWITHDSRRDVIGSNITPLGFLFYDQKENLTTLEMTRSKTSMFPPSIAVALHSSNPSICTATKANGPNYAGQFASAGLTGVGGMCNWVPVW